MRWPSRCPLGALLVLGVFGLLLAACGSTPPVAGSFVVGGARPALVVPPPDHDRSVPTPLLVVLHGYQSSADQVERLFPLATAAEVLGVAVVRPQGAIDSLSRRFWNASKACCNLYGFPVDDVGYLTRLIDEVAQEMAVSQVMLFGHSNGGFMAYRLACDYPERFAAVVTIAGALDTDPQVPACGADGPARVLHIHGTEDRVIRYGGGSVSDLPIPLMPNDIPPYSAAEVTVGAFVSGAGCGPLVAGTPFDLDLRIDGAETVPLEAACPEGRRVALWRMVDSGHEPRPGSGFAARVLWFALGW